MQSEAKRHLVGSLSLGTIMGVMLAAYLATKVESNMVAPIIGAIFILTLILLSLLLAIFYAPRKLYLTTGVAIAFIFAAVLFEVFVLAKQFMETTGSV